MGIPVVAVPTERTLKRMMDIMLDAPFTLDFKAMYVLIAEPDTVPAGLSDTALFDDVKVLRIDAKPTTFLHEKHQHATSSLVAVVRSKKLQERSRLMGSDTDEHEWLLKYDFPVSIRARKFVNMIADILVMKEEEPFSFVHEITLGDDN